MLRLQKNNLVSSTLKASSNGPKRKYFTLTEKGQQELVQFRENWIDLFTSVNKLMGGIGNE
ncbi:MAG: PadR family transcriptional regulator, partial [Intestinibacter sp.]|uniref:PadR family transcriptional regulator n=1 Tax=Intestinibacter sp. TaxID=1965304 RepID=UPI003F16EC9A